MLRHRRAGMLASVGAAAASLIIAGTASAATAGRTQLLNSRSPAAATTPQTGQASASTQMDFEVDLALPDPGAAQAFSQAVSTPGNALYQQFLTPSQWEARFAPTQASVDQVTSFLTQNGFTVGDVSADRMAVEATGTVQQVEQTFGTTLSYHTVAGNSVLLAGQNLSVPSGIAGVLAGVSGVNDIKAAPDDTTGGPADTTGAAATGTPAERPRRRRRRPRRPRPGPMPPSRPVSARRSPAAPTTARYLTPCCRSTPDTGPTRPGLSAATPGRSCAPPTTSVVPTAARGRRSRSSTRTCHRRCTTMPHGWRRRPTPAIHCSPRSTRWSRPRSSTAVVTA